MNIEDAVKFWAAGEREVKKSLRRTLFKYKLHQDTDLFDRAYEYIRQYYQRQKAQQYNG